MLDGAEVADNVTLRELLHVSVQVFGADLVEGAVKSPLEQRPEGFDAIGAAFAVNILASAVVDGAVPIRKIPVAAMLVGVNGGTGVGTAAGVPALLKKQRASAIPLQPQPDQLSNHTSQH